MLRRFIGPRLHREQPSFCSSDEIFIVDEWILPNGHDAVEASCKNSSRPKVIISEHYAKINNLEYQDILHPISAFFYHEAYEFKKLNIPPPNTHTQQCFNFVINRRRLPRLLFLRLLEYFSLQTNNYSLCFSNTELDASPILPLIDAANIDNIDKLKTKILGPVLTKPRIWCHGSYTETAEEYNYEYDQINSVNYKNIISNIIDPTATSIIIETVGTENATAFTEKSLMPIMGMTFPIWFGGWQQPSTFQKFGFDIFDDVIDHSYENYDNYIERCYHALHKNVNILSDLTLASELRNKHQDRLKANRDWLLSDKFLELFFSKIKNNFSKEMFLEIEQYIFHGYEPMADLIFKL